jgi:hypothetical protein
MNYRPLLSLALLLVFGLTISLGAEDKIKESEYYPFAVGSTWKYTVNGKEKITVRVAKHEKVGDQMCALVETLADDKVVTTEQVGVKSDGLYRYSLAGMKADPPVRFLKLPPKKGDTWDIKSKIGAEELATTYTISEGKVKVPAGEYDAVVAETGEFMAGGVKMSAKVWFVKDIGMVKIAMKIMGNDVNIELDKFEKGK